VASLCTSICLAMGIVATASADVLHVPGEYVTIAAANQVAAPGDTILVAPGTHTEPETARLSSGVRLIGDGGAESATVQAPGIDVLTLTPGDSTLTIIEGLTIERTNPNNNLITVNGNPLTIVRKNRLLVDGTAISSHGPLTLENNVIGVGEGAGISIHSGPLPGVLSIAYNVVLTAEDGGLSLGSGLPGEPFFLPGSKVHHNTFVHPPYVWSWSASELDSGFGGPVAISSNLFFGFEFFCHEFAEPPEMEHNLFFRWSTSTLGECPPPSATNLLDVDPLLCDVVGLDWRLGPGSPCIGAGEGGTHIGALEAECFVPIDDEHATSPVAATSRPHILLAGEQIRVYVPADGRTRLDVYDAGGRRLRTAMDRHLPRGWHHVGSGSGNQTRPEASGVYFLRLLTEAGSATERLVVAR